MPSGVFKPYAGSLPLFYLLRLILEQTKSGFTNVKRMFTLDDKRSPIRERYSDIIERFHNLDEDR